MSLFRKNLGKKGEDLACSFIKKKGYRVVTRNFRKKCGEIDIIAYEDEVLVFIEVKTRSNDSKGSPLEAVNKRKQQQIIKTATYYLAENDSFDVSCRFDVLGITVTNNQPPLFVLIQGAFELS